MSRPYRLAVAAALLFAPSVPAQELIDPTLDVPIAAFEAEIDAGLEARGDSMGFGFDLCPLDPPFFAADTTYIARSFADPQSAGEIVLVAVEDGLVRGWREFDLPEFAGWITHFSRVCDATGLSLSEGGEEFFRYRWDGVTFLAE